MRKANEMEYEIINHYFKETGWSIDANESVVLVSDSSEEVANYIGIDTIGMSYDEILDSLDVSNVWYDSESSNYYVIVQ